MTYTRDELRHMSREQRSRWFRDATHARRVSAHAACVDHIANRPSRAAQYSRSRYKNLLRCPKVVFGSYGPSQEQGSKVFT